MSSVTTDSGHSHSDSCAKEDTALLLRSSGIYRTAADVESYIASPWSPATELKNRCLEAFFHFFSLAHPFVLPKLFLTQMLRVKPLPHLEAAMRYVGSHYIKTAPTEFIAQEATQLLSRHDCVRDGFTVQAMLLLAIGLDGNTEFDKANDMLRQAQDLALEIGMNHRAFAVMHGEGLAVLEESWRRTWWELYVVDGMIAGVHERTSFRLNEMPIEVLLPCEEQEYVSGVSFLNTQCFTESLQFSKYPCPTLLKNLKIRHSLTKT
jgi:Fungal specific transcription factor domain